MLFAIQRSLMAAELTRLQRQILDAICDAMEKYGRPPSVRELGGSVGITSRDELWNQLLAIRRAGYLRANPAEPNAIEVHCDKARAQSADRAGWSPGTGRTVSAEPHLPARRVVSGPATVEGADFVDVPLLVQEIGGGAPVLAPTTPVSNERQTEAIYSLPRGLVGAGDLFMLRVRGDSMAGDGVLDGDYIVVRAQKTAAHGEMILAMLDTEPPELTVKYLRLRGRRIDRLVPASPDGPVIEGQRVAEIQGKVVAVIRSLARMRPA
jgi:repressor LexA